MWFFSAYWHAGFPRQDRAQFVVDVEVRHATSMQIWLHDMRGFSTVLTPLYFIGGYRAGFVHDNFFVQIDAVLALFEHDHQLLEQVAGVCKSVAAVPTAQH